MRTQAANTLFEFYQTSGNVHTLLTKRAEACLPHRLTMAQFGVLDDLRQSQSALTPLELAVSFSLTKGAITNSLKQLEKKGFIVLSPHPVDGRSKLVSLSEQGRAAHRASLIALSELTSGLLAEFSTLELVDALPFMTKLQNWLKT